MSRPSRARGLKLGNGGWQGQRKPVAPFPGAWIETCDRFIFAVYGQVAPFPGAWIETICTRVTLAVSSKSRPSRARGLKLLKQKSLILMVMSRPSRARGLKQYFVLEFGCQCFVAPFPGAWIETNHLDHDPHDSKSRPSRARGLKPFVSAFMRWLGFGRALPGRVD